MGCSKSSSKREVHGNTGLSQKIRKLPNSLTYHLKKLEKEVNPKVKPKIRRKEIIIREEIKQMKKSRKDQ